MTYAWFEVTVCDANIMKISNARRCLVEQIQDFTRWDHRVRLFVLIDQLHQTAALAVFELDKELAAV